MNNSQLKLHWFHDIDVALLLLLLLLGAKPQAQGTRNSAWCQPGPDVKTTSGNCHGSLVEAR
jgi:hypothetical protein